jgi:hypothetical protein
LRASSRELIENVVKAPLRDGVLALVDDASDGQRLARAGRWARKVPTNPVAILRSLLSRSGDLRSLAVCYAAETQLIDVDEATQVPPNAASSVLGAGLAERVREALAARGVVHED